MKVWLFPEGVEREYARQLVQLSRRAQRETIDRMKARKLLARRDDGAPVRADAWIDDLSQLFLELLAAMLRPGQETVLRLRDTFTAISQFNDRQWRIQVKAGTGIEIGASGALPPGARMALGSVTDPNSIRAVFGMGVDVYRAEPWLRDLQENWISENTRLIKSIPEKYLADVEQVIRTGVMQGQGNRAIAKELQRVAGISEARAKLIAADQTAKANGSLTRYRQMDLGVKQYKWMSSDDQRVRPTHRDADGNIYDWKRPPSITGAHPGLAIRCRCWASPLLLGVAGDETDPRSLTLEAG